MLVRNLIQRLHERGDTLVEVTFALAIMATVIISATSVAAQAFRLSSTARERTQLVNAAIEQAEGLRSLRDNHSWAEFLYGNAIGVGHFDGVQNVSLHNCSLPSLAGKQCFAMGIVGGQWVPVSAAADTSNNSVPPQTAIEIYRATAGTADVNCAVKFEVHYGSPSISSPVWQEGAISVELANSRYTGGTYTTRCEP